MLGMSLRLTSWVFAVLLLQVTSAWAEINFCNQFTQKIYVAIAYPQDGGSWLSRGWLEIAPKECNVFDSALRVTTFYFRAESVPYRDSTGNRATDTWGKGKSFAIWEDNNFQYYDAEHKVLNSTLKPFTSGPEGMTDGTKVTVTFTQTGSLVEIGP
jgi:Protein of unknown function (DUF1036)